MKLKWFALAMVLVGSLIVSACNNTNTNTNTTANANTNAASPEMAATPAARGNERGTYTEKQAQEERARAKQNKETIGDSLDDAWIHTKIVAKLIGDTKTPERKINVDVVKNVVTLRGTVDTAEAKTEAEHVAKDTDGVKSVKNELKIAPAAKASPKTSPGKTKPTY